MKNHLRLVTPPTQRAVTIQEARRHMRIEDTESDDLVDMYLRAAEQSLANVGRAFKPATYALDLYYWPSHLAIQLPMPPLRSITDVSVSGTTVDPSLYNTSITDEGRGFVFFSNTYSWPPFTFGQVQATITFEAGYDEVPAALRASILLVASSLYDNRAGIAPINIYSVPGVDALLSPFKEQYV